MTRYKESKAKYRNLALSLGAMTEFIIIYLLLALLYTSSKPRYPGAKNFLSPNIFKETWL